jgi:hypothetical protein
MSDGLSKHTKYLAMRAKKMTAHMGDVPTPGTLRDLFARKGTEINMDEARTLVNEVKKHRDTVGIGGRAPKKPQKKEVAAASSRSSGRQRYSTSYGR